MISKKAAAAVALALTLGPPAWAAKVYVPYAIHQEDRGVVQRTEVVLTNGQPGLAQKVSYRLIDDRAPAAARPFGSVDLAGGKSVRLNAPVAAGGRGLLEIDAPVGVVVGARLVVMRPGADPVESNLPVFDARGGYAGGALAVLQGLSRVEGVHRSGIGVVNLGGKAAPCEVTVADAAGNAALGGAVQFALAPKAQGFHDDLYDLFGAEVPEDAVATVACDQQFWAYAVVSDESTGAARFVEPAYQSMAQPVTALASTVFTLPGTFLTSSKDNHNWQYNMRFPTVTAFRKAILDFDVWIKGWDPAKPGGFHCLFWLNQGKSWANMFGYLNAIGTKNRTRFEVNYGGLIAQAVPIGMKPGNTYHIHYEYDLIGKRVGYTVTQGSTTLINKWYPRSGANFSTNWHRIQFGTQIAPEGPEARTYGWKFSNFRAEYVP